MFQLLKKIKVHRLMLLAALLFIVLQSIADLYVPSLLAEVTKTAAISGNIKEMILQGAVALSVVVASIVANIISGLFASKVAAKFAQNVRSELFKKVESLGVEEYEKFGASSLITRTTNDITQVQQALFMMMRMMIIAPIMMIGGIVMTYRLNASLMLVVLSALPVIILFVGIVAKQIIPMFKQMQENLDKLNLITKESITGIRVVRAFANESSDEKKFQAVSKNVADISIKANQIMGFSMPFVQFVFSITTLFIVWFGLKSTTSFTDSANVIAVMQYSMRIMVSFVMMIMLFIFIPRASVCAKRVMEVFNTEVKIQSGNQTVQQQEGKLEFQNVGFAFADASQNALTNVNFSVKKGEILAIIGGTGSGKSTIANLIPRFFDVTEGSIVLDGLDIKNLDIKSLREKIAFVPQTPVIFNRTIQENVLYGANDISFENLNRALELAQAKEFVSKLENQHEYLLSQNGKNLSGGQKQRIAIARAIAKKAEILVFDDSFSALDYKTDAQVRSGLKPVFEESTTIIVAQRVSSITDANQILVLDEGKVVGYGTFEELKKSCPAFQEIIKSQAKKEES